MNPTPISRPHSAPPAWAAKDLPAVLRHHHVMTSDEKSRPKMRTRMKRGIAECFMSDQLRIMCATWMPKRQYTPPEQPTTAMYGSESAHASAPQMTPAS